VFPVTASSPTSFQYTNTATGLGAGSSFGNGCPGMGCVGITTNLTNAAAGQCDPPTDINTDGTGTDLFYRNWVGAYAAHVNVGPWPGTRRKSLTRGFWGTAEMQLREHTLSVDVTAGAVVGRFDGSHSFTNATNNSSRRSSRTSTATIILPAVIPTPL
jgi:hypothetical protein